MQDCYRNVLGLVVAQIDRTFPTSNWTPGSLLPYLQHTAQDPILSHMNAVHAAVPYFCEAQFNIILPL